MINPVGDERDGRRAAHRGQAADVSAAGTRTAPGISAGVGPAAAPKLGAHWLAELNLNPRYRGAAGLWRRGRAQEPGGLCRRLLGPDRRHPRRRDEVQPDAAGDRGASARSSASTSTCCRPSGCCRCSARRCRASRRWARRRRPIKINGKVASLGGQARPLQHAGGDGRRARCAASPARLQRAPARWRRALNGADGRAAGRGQQLRRRRWRAATTQVRGVRGQCLHARRHPRHHVLRRRRPRAAGHDRARPVAASACRGKITVGEVKQALAARERRAEDASRATACRSCTIRAGQHRGVFTDLHVDRFGTLAAQTSTLTVGRATGARRGADRVARQARHRRLPGRGDSSTAASCRSARCSSTARSGAVPARQATGALRRRAAPLRRRRDAAASDHGARRHPAGPGQPRPTCASSTTAACSPRCRRTRVDLQAGNAGSGFKLNDGLRVRRASATAPAQPQRGQHHAAAGDPQARRAEPLREATRGCRRTWRDAVRRHARRGADGRLPARAGRAESCARAPDPALTLPLRLASRCDCAGTALDTGEPARRAFLPRTRRLDQLAS